VGFRTGTKYHISFLYAGWTVTKIISPENNFQKRKNGGCMKISARNALKGKVKEINQGAVNTEIIIELAGGETITSVITKSSAERLELVAGKEVYAVIKASNVMIAVD